MKVHVLGGGTSAIIRPHFAVSAPAYGTLAKKIDVALKNYVTSWSGF